MLQYATPSSNKYLYLGVKKAEFYYSSCWKNQSFLSYTDKFVENLPKRFFFFEGSAEKMGQNALNMIKYIPRIAMLSLKAQFSHEIHSE